MHKDTSKRTPMNCRLSFLCKTRNIVECILCKGVTLNELNQVTFKYLEKSADLFCVFKYGLSNWLP